MGLMVIHVIFPSRINHIRKMYGQVISLSELPKLPKPLALYLPIEPPPLLFSYRCEFCKFWTKDEKCEIVSEKGPPNNNKILAEAWCWAWWPNGKNEPLSWLSGEQVTTDGRKVSYDIHPTLKSLLTSGLASIL